MLCWYIANDFAEQLLEAEQETYFTCLVWQSLQERSAFVLLAAQLLLVSFMTRFSWRTWHCVEAFSRLDVTTAAHACSIKRNICYGLETEDGWPADEVPTTEDVEEAARLANAHDFIMGLPQGYDTVTLPCYQAASKDHNNEV